MEVKFLLKKFDYLMPLIHMLLVASLFHALLLSRGYHHYIEVIVLFSRPFPCFRSSV